MRSLSYFRILQSLRMVLNERTERQIRSWITHDRLRILRIIWYYSILRSLGMILNERTKWWIILMWRQWLRVTTAMYVTLVRTTLVPLRARGRQIRDYIYVNVRATVIIYIPRIQFNEEYSSMKKIAIKRNHILGSGCWTMKKMISIQIPSSL